MNINETLRSALTSSTGEGVKLRIKSLLILAVPILNYFLETKGLPSIDDPTKEAIAQLMINVIDTFSVLAFITTHAYGWIRAWSPEE